MLHTILIWIGGTITFVVIALMLLDMALDREDYDPDDRDYDE